VSPAIADDELRTRLLKVLRLARQGIGGEKENAEALLAKMLRRHGLSPADLHELEGEPRELHWLKTVDDMQVTILAGLLAALFGRDRELWTSGKNARKLGINLSRAEAVSIDIAWEVYSAAWEDAKLDLALAFIMRHRLIDPKRAREPGDDVELSAAEKARLRRADAMIDVLEHVDRPVPRVGSRSA
jgi:hypothetical protein